MRVKWHEKLSSLRNLNGGGPQGGTLGIWEYLSLTNDNLEFVNGDSKFKFVDDAFVLEIINILSAGLATYNIRNQIPSNIPSHNQIIPREHLQSQIYLETLKKWSDEKKMILNLDKTKVIIFNFSKEKQFTVSLQINEKTIEVVNEVKLLGTIITSDLKWDKNINEIIRRCNIRMTLLRKLVEFRPKIDDMKIIYMAYIRSVAEQSCQVWHFSLSQENCEDIERIQKNACKIILGSKYENYENALNILNLEDLKSRRERLCKKFAEKCIENEKTKNMFPKNTNLRKTYKSEEFKVQFARTERLKCSSIPQMQRQLNN